MLRSILKRILYMLIVVWVVSIMSFRADGAARQATLRPLCCLIRLRKNSARPFLNSWV